MHPYAINSSERKIVIVVLTIISIACAYAIGLSLPKLEAIFGVSLWWLDMPAVFGCFGGLYFAFDRWLWRVPVLRSIGLVQTPNLAGSWVGTSESSHDDFANSHEMRVTIHQSWTEICIRLSADHSTSESTMASFTIRPGKSSLQYSYLNQPHAHAAATMHIHGGTTCLNLGRDPNGLDHLEGDYYSGRDRGTIGRMRLSRIR